MKVAMNKGLIQEKEDHLNKLVRRIEQLASQANMPYSPYSNDEVEVMFRHIDELTYEAECLVDHLYEVGYLSWEESLRWRDWVRGF